MERGEVVGFAQVGAAPGQHDGDHDRGVIRFLIYPPGRRDVGDAVLRGADAYFQQRELRDAEAFVHGYTYRSHHLGFGNLSATLGHVHGLLGSHGYRVADAETFLLWEEYEDGPTCAPDPCADVTATTTDGGGDLPDFTVAATLEGETFATCISHSVGHYSLAPAAQGTFFTTWLGVADDRQGVGWGRFVLTRALHVGRNLGYRDAVISTDAQNYRALLFYTNLGYRVVNTGFSFRKGR